MSNTTLLYINGTWERADSGRLLPYWNPATGGVIGEVAAAGASDLDRALAAADNGFNVWRRISAFDRYRILRKAAELLRSRSETIARDLTLEQGKTLAEARGE